MSQSLRVVVGVLFLSAGSSLADDPPGAVNDQAYALAGQSIAIPVLNNDVLPEGSVVSITNVGAASLGTTSSGGEVINYQANSGASGTDTFSYTIANANGTSTATVTVIVRTSNAPPSPQSDIATVEVGSSVAIAVLQNDSDPNNDPLTIAVETDPTYGTAVAQTDGTILYISPSTTIGTDTFSYRVTDAFGASATASVEVSIVPSSPPQPLPSPVNANTFYVSPTGDDQNGLNAGTDPNQPLRTILRAKELASARLNSGATSVTVYLGQGKHALISPASAPVQPGITITDSDTPPGTTLTFAPKPGETAIIHGAIEFSGSAGGGHWESAPLLSQYDGSANPSESFAATKNVDDAMKFVFEGALRAELQQRILNLRNADINGGKACFTQLFAEKFGGSERKIRARHPNVNHAKNVDTSPFTWPDANPIANQNPIVRFKANLFRLAGINFERLTENGSTEVVFTRAWTNPRGLITSAIPTNISGTNYVKLVMDGMENPPIGTSYTFPYERALAELNPITSLGSNVNGDLETWNRGWLENNLTFVDVPGEWFFDENNIELYYFPPDGEPVDTLVFQLPVTFNLIRLQGSDDEHPVTGVQFDGGDGNERKLEFRCNAWKYENGRGNSKFYSYQHGGYGLSGLIDGFNVDRFKLFNCRFSQFGSCAVSLGGNRQALLGKFDNHDYNNQPRGIVAETTIDNNIFEDGGGGAVRISHYPRLQSPGRIGIPENNIISRNIISSVGKYFADSAAINVMHGINTRIESNTISFVPSRAISVGAQCSRAKNEKLVVKGNVIQKAMQFLIDGGAIYTPSGRKTVITENKIKGTGSSRPADAEPYIQIADIYLDRLSQIFTVSKNANPNGSPIGLFYHPGSGHNFGGQLYTTYTVLAPMDFSACPDTNEDLASCGCGLSFEAEALERSVSAGDTMTLLNDADARGGQSVLANSNAVDDTVSFTVPNVPQGDYLLRVGFKKDVNRAIVQTRVAVIGGTPTDLGSPIDLYSASPKYVRLEIADWSTGVNTNNKLVRFKVTGKNAASSGRTMCIDYIELVERVW